MSTIVTETDLLPAIYDGPFEQPMWSTFLDRLRARTRADYACITFRPPGRQHNGTVTLFAGRAGEPGVRLGHDTGLREERVYAGPELAASNQRDVGSMRVIRVTEPGNVSAWIELRRSGPDFTPADGALLSKIAPDFRRALRTYAEIERHKSASRIASEVMERLNFGWIAFDARGVVIEESAEAARLLQHGAGLRRTGSGRLIASDPLVDRRLAAAIRAACERTSGQPRALNVSQDPWVDLLLVPATPDPASPTGEAAAVAYIQGDSRSLAGRHEQLAELFGLLPSEARFALALSRGKSIAEAAAHLGLTIETARNYSKKVYAKTGARGQADLIRFILTSVLALA